MQQCYRKSKHLILKLQSCIIKFFKKEWNIKKKKKKTHFTNFISHPEMSLSKVMACNFCSLEEENYPSRIQACSNCRIPRYNRNIREYGDVDSAIRQWATNNFKLYRIGRVTNFEKEFFLFFISQYRHSVCFLVFSFVEQLSNHAFFFRLWIQFLNLHCWFLN
jgi:hypothetical protein